MRQNETTYRKIVSFLIVIGFIILALFLIRIYFKLKLENQIIDSSKVHFNHEVNALVEMNDSMMSQTVYDYSLWDEFVKAIEHKDTSWCRSNITLINTFKYDYICICNKKFEVLCEFDNVGGLFRNLIPKGALNSSDESKRPQFFLMTHLGLMEVTYTSVRPTFNTKHDKPQPAGYLYVGRRWDKEFLSNLTKIIGAPAHFVSAPGQIQSNDSKSINAQINLQGWGGKVITSIVFTKVLNHSFNATQNTMYIAMLVALTILLIVNAFARKYIHRPLTLITEILKSENKDFILKLKEYPAEFGRIGDLFEKFVSQKKEFENAKQKTEESAEQLRAIFENSLDAIRITKNGRIVLFNQAYANLFGYEDGNELLGKHVLEQFPPANMKR
jgi:PAS domain-containing protein